MHERFGRIGEADGAIWPDDRAGWLAGGTAAKFERMNGGSKDVCGSLTVATNSMMDVGATIGASVR